MFDCDLGFSDINAEVSQHNESVKLIIKPSICLVDGEEKECKSRFDISWQSESQLRSCIFLDYQLKSIQCWQEKSSGTVIVDFEHEDSVIVTLENRAIDITYASSKIRVMNKASLSKRRLRNPWDFL